MPIRAALSSWAARESPGECVVQVVDEARFRDTESDDEGENRRARDEMEILLTDKRQHTALEPDHRADKRVQADEEAELRGVRAQPKPYVGHARGWPA